ncbi:hypothetical protein H4R34_001344 [Dimargaris verticillata]|uniref:CDP-alcohol phosphatidyltransferase-domain-containing protein n=1 Tax=Dimargaris verticillata TaxID=2761393 RepID=A0A9W8B4M1_9FUNG|nr:hypothetical protein H4R34_001344 [Dimargaris verticillata]
MLTHLPVVARMAGPHSQIVHHVRLAHMLSRSLPQLHNLTKSALVPCLHPLRVLPGPGTWLPLASIEKHPRPPAPIVVICRQKSSKPSQLQKTKENAKLLMNKLQKLPIRENIYTIPNVLTIARLAASPYIGYLIVQHQYEWALVSCVVVGLTDVLDGYIARRYNMASVAGSILDPAADKALMTALTVSLAMCGLLPVPLAALILGRDGGLVLAAVYYRYISLPPPKTLIRYFDFSLPSAEVHPTFISKVNTACQLALMMATLASPLVGMADSAPLLALQYTVAATTVASGLSYVFSKTAVRILTKPQQARPHAPKRQPEPPQASASKPPNQKPDGPSQA